MLNVLTYSHRMVEDICKSIEEKAKYSIAERMFSISVDKEVIAKWKGDLARYIAMFTVSHLLLLYTSVT